MSFRDRVGAQAPNVNRVLKDVAPVRLRSLLRETILEELGAQGAYVRLCDVAGAAAEDIWSDEWASPRVRSLTDDLNWVHVYELLEDLAPRPLSGLEAYENKVNSVLATEGVGYEMVNGQFDVYDPERRDLGLEENAPIAPNDTEFAPVYAQYQRALVGLTERPADYLAAIREATNAVEAAGRIIAKKPSAVLGDVVDTIIGKGAEPHRRTLAATIKVLYGYASTVPGARHGQHTTVQIEYPEAAFVVRVAGAAIALLIAEHRNS